MDRSTDDLPPPYVPSASTVLSSLNSQTSAVPRWIIVYAMVGKPMLWILHRVANGLIVYSERGTDAFYGWIVAFAGWGLASLLIVAIVYAGGAHAWAQPLRRPRLLRFGLSCSIAVSILLVGLMILLIGASLSAPQANETQNSGPGDLAAGLSVLIWVAGSVAEWLAWRRLGRIGIRNQ